MTLYVHHRTLYNYLGFAKDSRNEVRLKPISEGSQLLLGFRLTTFPQAVPVERLEPGGTVHTFAIEEPHETLEIVAESVVEMSLADPFRRLNLVRADRNELATDAGALLEPSRLVPDHPVAREWADRAWQESGGVTANFLLALKRKVFETLDYDDDATTVSTTAADVFKDRKGVCQDFTHAFLAAARAGGVPSRYVCGYLYAATGDGLRGEAETHAWAECLLPGGSWVGFDPTNDVLANDRHIRLHWGRDFSDVSPTRGVFTGLATERLEVSVMVRQTFDERAEALGLCGTRLPNLFPAAVVGTE